MTATPTTAGDVLDDDRTADFRLSTRQRGMLRTLNMLFDEQAPAMPLEEDLIEPRNRGSATSHVSQTVRV